MKKTFSPVGVDRHRLRDLPDPQTRPRPFAGHAASAQVSSTVARWSVRKKSCQGTSMPGEIANVDQAFFRERRTELGIEGLVHFAAIQNGVSPVQAGVTQKKNWRAASSPGASSRCGRGSSCSAGTASSCRSARWQPRGGRSPYSANRSLTIEVATASNAAASSAEAAEENRAVLVEVAVELLLVARAPGDEVDVSTARGDMIGPFPRCPGGTPSRTGSVVATALRRIPSGPRWGRSSILRSWLLLAGLLVPLTVSGRAYTTSRWRIPRRLPNWPSRMSEESFQFCPQQEQLWLGS